MRIRVAIITITLISQSDPLILRDAVPLTIENCHYIWLLAISVDEAGVTLPASSIVLPVFHPSAMFCRKQFDILDGRCTHKINIKTDIRLASLRITSTVYEIRRALAQFNVRSNQARM